MQAKSNHSMDTAPGLPAAKQKEEKNSEHVNAVERVCSRWDRNTEQRRKMVTDTDRDVRFIKLSMMKLTLLNFNAVKLIIF